MTFWPLVFAGFSKQLDAGIKKDLCIAQARGIPEISGFVQCYTILHNQRLFPEPFLALNEFCLLDSFDKMFRSSYVHRSFPCLHCPSICRSDSSLGVPLCSSRRLYRFRSCRFHPCHCGLRNSLEACRVNFKISATPSKEIFTLSRQNQQ